MTKYTIFLVLMTTFVAPLASTGHTLLFDHIDTIVASAPVLQRTEGLEELIDTLRKEHKVTIDGSDKENRPPFVGVQYAAERAMTILYEEEKIKDLIGFIHTDAPATPLCTEGEISEGLVHPSLLSDEFRLDTIKIRVESMRKYLDTEAPLYVLFTEHGKGTRSVEQLNVFESLDYENLHKVCLTKVVGKLDNKYSGATFFYTDMEDMTHLFSIHSYQAHSPIDGLWTLWAGPLSDEVIKERTEEILSFLIEIDGGNLLP